MPSVSGVTMKSSIRVVGLVTDEMFYKAALCAKDLADTNTELFEAPLIQPLFEFEWGILLEQVKQEVRDDLWSYQDKAFCYLNGNQLIGGPNRLLDWAASQHNFKDFRSPFLYKTLIEEGYSQKLKEGEFVYLDINIGDSEAGRLVVQLFSDALPKTCENFRSLCTGEKDIAAGTLTKLHYKNSIFHRLVKNGWIQGGDINDGKGNGGESIYGKCFDDENFIIKHDARGIVSMANNGRHSNQSQFIISLKPSPWMDGKYVAFGRVVEGTDTLKAMESQDTTNERPVQSITIHDCGIYTVSD